MIRHLAAASLAVVLITAPIAAFAQTEASSTSTYSDAMPKKSKAHHAKSHGHHHKAGHKAKHHRASRRAGKTAK